MLGWAMWLSQFNKRYDSQNASRAWAEVAGDRDYWPAISLAHRFHCASPAFEPSAFGKVALVGVYMAFVAIFVDQGIGAALVQRSNLRPEHLNAAFWFNVGCAALLCAGTIVFAGPVPGRSESRNWFRYCGGCRLR